MYLEKISVIEQLNLGVFNMNVAGMSAAEAQRNNRDVFQSGNDRLSSGEKNCFTICCCVLINLAVAPIVGVCVDTDNPARGGGIGAAVGVAISALTIAGACLRYHYSTGKNKEGAESLINNNKEAELPETYGTQLQA